MHWPGIEPGPPAWQARILPLNHQCLIDITMKLLVVMVPRHHWIVNKSIEAIK